MGSSILRPRDRVIQTSNNYQIGVYNGEIGFVVGRDKVSGKARVRFEGSTPGEFNEVEYTNKELLDLSLAYAMTIHRSQGSEFPAVIMPMTRSYTIMLARNLVYTGVTRGRKLVVMVGDKSALAIAVKNNKPNERCSVSVLRTA
jgi:exodeoxyribonuclease V alpha subunit